MSFSTRFTGVLLTFMAGSVWLGSAAGAQESKVTYLSPAESAQKKGSAPGMKVLRSR